MELKGIVAQVISFVRVVRDGAFLGEVKADGDGGDPRTFQHTAPPGDDSPPLPVDRLAGLPIPGTGRWAAVGYVDIETVGKSLTGEKRIFARDESGAQVAEVWLRRDGAIEVQNDAISLILNASGAFSVGNGPGSIAMAEDGTVTINGATISPSGEITNAAGIVLGTHTHGPGSFTAGGDSVVGTSDGPS